MPEANHAPVDIPVHDPPTADEQTADGERLRAVMRHLASPVTIVTVAAGEEVRGATIGSFTSLSLHPPLVSFNAIRGTNFHGALRRADEFVVHILGEDQADLADHFALPDLSSAELFEAASLRAAPGDKLPPVIEGALAVIQCKLWKTVPAGDHDLVIGRVIEVESSDDDRGPLVYFRRAYRGVGEEA